MIVPLKKKNESAMASQERNRIVSLQKLNGRLLANGYSAFAHQFNFIKLIEAIAWKGRKEMKPLK